MTTAPPLTSRLDGKWDSDVPKVFLGVHAWLRSATRRSDEREQTCAPRLLFSL
jgi:hypothetical protein